MRTRIFSLAATLLATLAAVTPPAPARAADSPGAADVQERSSQLYRKARALQMDAKWTEAEAAYQAAWDLRKTFDIAGNLGDCELHVGQSREAAEHLTYALANFPAGGTQPQKDALSQRLHEARRQVGTLHVRTSPSGAAVLVDGRPAEDLPDGLVFVDPGSRTVEARLQGYGTARRTIDAQADSEQDVELTLSAVVTPPPTTAPTPTRPPTALLVTGGVLAAAGIAVGIGMTVAANGKGSARVELLGKVGGESGCSQPSSARTGECASLLSTAKSQSAFRNGAVAAFVTGGGLALVTGGLAVWAAAKPVRVRDGLRIQVVPTLGATERGAMVTGTW